MAAYLLCIRETPVRDEAEMAEYQRMNREAPKTFQLEPLVVYGKLEALEGEAPDGVILLKFSNADEARAWYNSPDYQASLPHRQAAADYRMILVEGL